MTTERRKAGKEKVMKIIIIFILLCGSLHAADTTNSLSSDRRLVEVSFTKDDKSTSQSGHIVTVLWISEKSRGLDRHVYSWAHQGFVAPDTDNSQKAAESLKLLETLDEPKDLPASPNQIVTVRCLAGGDTIAKRFPIDQVPSEVHQILTLMGFRDEEFSRLKFIQKPSTNSLRSLSPSPSP